MQNLPKKLTNGAAQDLQVLSRFSRALAETTDLKEVKTIRDRAEAVRHYARSAALGFEIQNQAAELKLRAERRAGELLAGVVSHGGDRKSSSHDENLILADLGIDHNQSARWQREAAVPEETFEEYVRSAAQLGRELTSRGLLQLEKVFSRSQRSSRPLPPARNGKETLSPGIDKPETVAEIVAELRNHWGLLSSILKPVMDGGTGPLKLAERRLLKRLFSEVNDLHESLRALSQDSTAGFAGGGDAQGATQPRGSPTYCVGQDHPRARRDD